MKVGRFNVPEGACRETASVLECIGDKWTVFVIVSLKDGPMRFTELKRRISAVSQKMLTTTLRRLERDGFVTRTVTPTIPPRVDYELTKLGRDVITPLDTLAAFAIARRRDVEDARRRYDALSMK
jgi:DNA-binding HxlR family transcriptional regulator